MKFENQDDFHGFIFFCMVIASVIVGGIIYLYRRRKDKKAALSAPAPAPQKRPPSTEHLTEEQIAAIRRHNNLFEDVPLHNGREWKTLSTAELVEVCLRSADAVFEMHHRQFTLSEVIADTIDRCTRLASWMQSKQHSSFYMNSDMSAFIVGPRAVAQKLQEHIARLSQPKPELVEA